MSSRFYTAQDISNSYVRAIQRMDPEQRAAVNMAFSAGVRSATRKIKKDDAMVEEFAREAERRSVIDGKGSTPAS